MIVDFSVFQDVTEIITGEQLCHRLVELDVQGISNFLTRVAS